MSTVQWEDNLNCAKVIHEDEYKFLIVFRNESVLLDYNGALELIDLLEDYLIDVDNNSIEWDEDEYQN